MASLPPYLRRDIREHSQTNHKIIIISTYQVDSEASYEAEDLKVERCDREYNLRLGSFYRVEIRPQTAYIY